MPLSAQEQYLAFYKMLEGRTWTRDHPVFGGVLQWLKCPVEISSAQRDSICSLIQKTFGISEEELKSELLRSTVKETLVQSNGHVNGTTTNAVHEVERSQVPSFTHATENARREEDELKALLPTSGFFRDYCELTTNSEAPLVYHVFCALAGLAATINRRVYFDMGTQRIFPPMGVLILGPSGIKKTSAADIMVSILNEMQLTPVYAEKLTPEALIDAMKGGNATGLVYSPEMTVLISKQRYMESIIPLLTRFMDSPDTWKSETVMRGKAQLSNVAITCLMCSTLDWFVKNTPEALFGGGFIARNIMILQEASARVVAIPPPMNTKLREKIIIELARLHELEGQMTLTRGAYASHVAWYENEKISRSVDHEILETYYQRKPSHLLRFAMCLHLATCQTFEICEECWQRALDILEWTERFLPVLASRMFKSGWGEDQALVIKKIRAAGGTIEHSVLVRRMQYKMSSTQVRTLVNSLKEAGAIKEYKTTLVHTYVLTELSNEL